MSINKTTPSPLALREGFHVVLLRALAERLQGRDWVLKGGTNLRLYFGSIRFSEDIDLDVGKDVAGAMQRRHATAPFRRRWLTEMCNGVCKPSAYSRPR
jgi:predicted nucleotidyltransferase component of viral defense system